MAVSAPAKEPPARPARKASLQEKLGRWALLVLVILPLLIYANSLTNAFLYDDIHSLVDNPHIRKLENIPSFFTSTQTTSLIVDKGHYRPVLFSTYALSYALGGYDYDPRMFRVFNLAFHILNGLLLFAVFRRVAGDTAAFFAALLFAVHPLNTESVNYISCRSNVLATTFCLASVALFVGYAQSLELRRRAAFYLGALACFAMGLLTKEIVITLPAILILLDILILNPDAKTFALKTLFRRHVMFWVVAGLHLFLIFAVGLKPMYGQRGVLSNLIIQTKAMVFYLRLLVFPRGLSISHGFDIEGVLNAAFWVSLLIIGGILFLAWKLRRRYGLLSFAILWYFITLLPTSSVIALRIPVNEHRVYLPAVGFAVAVAFLFELVRGMSGPVPGRSGEAHTSLRSAPTLGSAGQSLSKLAVPLFVVVVGVFSVAVFARNQAWKTTITIWEDVVKKYPSNAHAHETLGLGYGNIGDLEKAEREFLLAVRYGGTGKMLAKSHNGLGIIYAQRNDFENAIKHYMRSIELDLRAVEPYRNLGITYAKQGRPAKALKYFQKAVEVSPYADGPYRDLAQIYLELGEIDNANGVLQEMKKRGMSVPEDLRKRLEAAAKNP
jgi:tetratricopeptide (TPR) repeat protein